MKTQIQYLVRAPKIIKEKNPLLLLLHGYGSNEEDLFAFASELPENYYVVSARAPYDLQPYGYAWYAINFDADQNKFTNNEQAIESRDLITKFLNQLESELPIDYQDVTLIGFSQGSILSYAVALTYPEKIKNVIALSGYLHPEIIPQNLDGRNFSHLKMFVSHGSQDQVIPVEWARQAPDFLQKLGVDVTYKEYPIGHGVSPQNFRDLLNWLNANN
ncbi:alpha/beta fold hydrolase [Flavobacterium sp. NST-5]|uniref:Alpha/beta fold hydrolase n=1 Tax=Flavobacterium ichthyis TaxID=2698827 RepID=A0ABW9Z5Y7_9FLAO|nr:alpha/beta fold hydrolase [Flavobacterium ichthyis]NBL63982.1 alpha/beta fold hydrolase [Flavobacterium ichthyis]